MAVEVSTPEADQVVFAGRPWEGAARLLDRARTVADLRAHRLHLLAAARLGVLSTPNASELAADVRRAQFTTLAAQALVTRIRAVCSGPLLVFKGPEAAAYYPAVALRPFNDVDVLVPDPHRTQRELLAAGFRPVGPELDVETLHHLQRLAPPSLACTVEVHKHPKWPHGLRPPRFSDLLAGAVASRSNVEGVLAPAPAAHAVLLAAHAWAERPLGTIGDLVDVVATSTAGADGEADELAARFGIGRVWRTTMTAARALFDDGALTWPLRTWARHLPLVRERTVLESHLERLLVPFSGLPPVHAFESAAAGVARTVRPARDESWSGKLHRARAATRNAFVQRSEHERRLGRREEADD